MAPIGPLYGLRYYHDSGAHYLAQVCLSVHAQIIGTTSRTTLTQNFVNSNSHAIAELTYTFPLYDGVSVVGFVCTISDERTIRGVVKERHQARETYDAAVARGETAGIIEQSYQASDVFTTSIGNVPAGAEIKVDITYLGELKHDAEADGIRFTIPTSIAPRYGDWEAQYSIKRPSSAVTASTKTGIAITVDAEMPSDSNIKSIQSPSHPISVTIGNTSTSAAASADMALSKASASLSLGIAELGGDFILHIISTNTANPIALLETHPTKPNQRALMATLVPKFNLPPRRPEIVFICDRSGSMGGENKIPNMIAALNIFLKSLPVGVKFNICSFGSHHEFLFKDGSRSYNTDNLDKAIKHVSNFDAGFGGTEIHDPLKQTFERRYKDMPLEVFLLTDGEVWNQESLFSMVNQYVSQSKQTIRVFTLGIGRDVSHALIEGVSRAGNGFSQAVGDNEKMTNKVVRMLKAALTPNVTDYTLEIKYEKDQDSDTKNAVISVAGDDDDFEVIEKVMDGMKIDVAEDKPSNHVPTKSTDSSNKPISLFNESANSSDHTSSPPSASHSDTSKYSDVPHVPEPKMLQAPFTIPPLYPFNRTSVYLLLSPETIQKTPKSVILRGKSTHGPLELEIPITVLSEKGETIHQLAARKAVLELEEGRGWLRHARDASKADGQLLKDKFPGRFSDMVEREAVRLGTGFGVGGKWCSFVAVDSDGSSSTQPVVSYRARASDIHGSSRPKPQYRKRASAPYSPSALCSYQPPDRAAFRPLDAPIPKPMFGGALPVLPAMKRFSQRVMSRPEPQCASAFGPRIVESSSSAPVTDSLETLVTLQSFKGWWTWGSDLVRVLNLDEAALKLKLENLLQALCGLENSTGFPIQFLKQDRLLATALALAALETRFMGRKDEWELVAEKAKGLLKEESEKEENAMDVTAYVDMAKTML